jgi:hypothetical protein
MSSSAEALTAESQSALELLERLLAPVELLDCGERIRPIHEELSERLARDEATVELAGLRRTEAVESLLGCVAVAPEPAAGATVRLRAGNELSFHARWPDGRTEVPLADPSVALSNELADIERRIVTDSHEVARLAAELESTARDAASARVELAPAEQSRAAPSPRPPPSPASRPGLRALLLRMLAWLARLFFRRPALPSAGTESSLSLAAVETELVLRTRQAAAAEERVRQVESALRQTELAFTTRSTERERLRHEIDLARLEHRRRIRERLVELTGAGAGSFEVDVTAPGVPEGVVILLRAPLSLWRESIDGRIAVDETPGEDLRERLEHLRDQRPLEIARRIVGVLCDCRNQVLDLERRARHAHEQRLADLTARRIASPQTLRRNAHAAAQPTAARQAHHIVDNAATRLESLLAEVRTDWEQRIASCAGLEQLRAEVAAIENGAEHRLSLLCDELKEEMTVQFIRLVLELSRSLRQELLHMRLEVARGDSARLEEAFEHVRVTLPATLDAAFRPLRTPDLGQLLSTERSLLDPLLKTLTREKRTCLTRLGARLDDIQQSTTRELYAVAVFISPLALNGFTGLVDELMAAHQRWIDERIAEEERSFQTARLRREPALELVPALEQEEARLAVLLESCR